MSDDVNSRDTVVIDENAHEIYKQLTEGNNVLGVPFRTMKDVFMWAVCLGIERGKKRPLTAKKVTIFRWAQFDTQTDVPLLKAIAIADSSDVNVLLARNDILAVIEEYANMGIYELRDSLIGDYGQPLWNLVNLLSQ